jgi:hypothetical protein
LMLKLRLYSGLLTDSFLLDPVLPTMVLVFNAEVIKPRHMNPLDKTVVISRALFLLVQE